MKPSRIPVLLAAISLTAALSAQSGAPLLPDDPYALFTGALGGKAALVAVEGRPFGKAVRVSVPEKPKNHWDVQAIVKSTAAAPGGSTLAFWFSCRSLKGEGKMLVTLKDKAGKGVFRQEFAVNEAWADKLISGTLEGGGDKGELSLILTFGWQAQEIEIGGFAFLALEAGAKPEALPRPPQTKVTASGAAGSPAATVASAPVAAETVEELPPLPEGVRRFAMFKWDDLKAQGKDVPAAFQRVADFAAAHKMHASMGIICNSFEQKNEAYHAWIRKWAVENGGPLEFWLHGYDHLMTQSNGRSYTEFNGPDYESQKTHFQKSMDLMKESTGLVFHSFGSAGNQYDPTSYKVISEFPDIKVWMFGDPKACPSLFCLPRLVEGEKGAGNPDFAFFMRGYKNNRTKEALLIQGHPNMWNDARFAEFEKIHAQLVKDKFEFVTPWEYYKFKNP